MKSRPSPSKGGGGEIQRPLVRESGTVQRGGKEQRSANFPDKKTAFKREISQKKTGKEEIRKERGARVYCLENGRRRLA